MTILVLTSREETIMKDEQSVYGIFDCYYFCHDCLNKFSIKEVVHYNTGEFRCKACHKEDLKLRKKFNLPHRKLMLSS